MVKNLPKSESILLGYLQLFCWIGDDVFSEKLIAAFELFDGDGRHDADDSGDEFGIGKIFFFCKWLDDNIIEILHVVVSSA